MSKHISQNISKPLTGNGQSKIYPRQDGLSEVGNFRDSYQICKYWLKSRGGWPLKKEDIQHYQNILTVLKEIVTLTEEIEITIQSEQSKKKKVLAKIRAIFVKEFGIKPERVIPGAHVVNDLKLGYLDAIKLAIALESTFKIEIPSHNAKTLFTVQQIIDYISRKVDTFV
jgi:acyl carrier protein